MARTGSIRKLTLKSQDQRVSADADFSRMPEWAKESIPTSGAPDIKWTKQNKDIEGVGIQCSGVERAAIEDFTQLDALDAAYVTANGDTYTSSVQIAITDDSTDSGKVTIKIMPLTDWSPALV